MSAKPVTKPAELRPNEIQHVGIYSAVCPKCGGPRNEFSGRCGHCNTVSVSVYKTTVGK